MRSLNVWKKLDRYQKNIVVQALRIKTLGVFAEQGTGKTWMTGGVIDRLVHRYRDFEGLVIVPLNNKETTWCKFFREELPHINVADSLDSYKEISTPKILLVHFEQYPKDIEKIRRIDWTFISIDESQRIKQRSTLASRTAAKLRDSAPYKLILSGTPIEQNPQDLWAQFRFLKPEVFGVRWKDFQNEYLLPVDIDLSKYRRGSLAYARMVRVAQIKESKRKFDPKKLPKFLALIKPYSVRVTKSVIAGLPSMNIIDHPVTLRGFQRKVYDDIKKYLVSPDIDLSAPLKVTQIVKLRQICGGHVLDDEGEIQKVGRAKLRAAKKIIQREKWCGSPVVIFCEYLEEIRMLQRELPGRVTSITGRVKICDRTQIIEEFQRGEWDVLILQTKTGGVGIDLFTSYVGIVYSPPYSHIVYDQAMSRLHRRGQAHDVRIYLLIAEDTIDRIIYEALRLKRKTSDVVLDYLQIKVVH